MTSSWARWTLGLAAVAVVFGSSITVEGVQTRTVQQGVYNNEQARRGQALYKTQCASCHGDTLGGRVGPPLTGEDFVGNWNTQPLFELASKIRNTMPQDAPGKLTPQQTADLIAFILQAGKFPAGFAELSAGDAALKQITWPAGNPVPAKAGGAQAPSFPPAGNLAQVMRGILFPAANLIFTVQTHDPGAPPKKTENGVAADEGFNWVTWGGNLYSGWELVDYASVALAESAPLMLTPGRRCENGKPVPVNDPDWIKFTNELADVGKKALKASQTRNQETVSDFSNDISDMCLHCHQVFRDVRAPGVNPLDPVASKANRCTKPLAVK